MFIQFGLRRFIAVFLIVTFCFQNVGYSLSETHHLRGGAGSVSADWGQRLSLSAIENAKFPLPDVWLIEDLHTSTAAQLQIARIIETLLSLEPGSFVAVEGATGPIDVSFFRNFPESSSRTMAAYTLLQQARISAAEYAAISAKNPIRLLGPENERLYTHNWKQFKKIRRNIQNRPALYNKISVLLSRLEKDILSRDLQRLIRATHILDNAEEGATDWFDDLKHALKKINSHGYESLKLQRLLAQKSLPTELSAESWIKEINLVLEKAIQLEARSELEIETVKLIRLLRQMNRILLLKATREDYVESRSVGGPKSLFPLISSMSRTPLYHLFSEDETLTLEKQYQSSLLFYQVAMMREKAISHFLQKSIRAQNGKKAILISGGFHTRGLVKLLKSEGLSTLILRPKNIQAIGDREYDQRALIKETDADHREFLKKVFYGMFGSALLKGFTPDQLRQAYSVKSASGVHTVRQSKPVPAQSSKTHKKSPQTIHAVNTPTLFRDGIVPSNELASEIKVHDQTLSTVTLESPDGFIQVEGGAEGRISVSLHQSRPVKRLPWIGRLTRIAAQLLVGGFLILMVSACTSTQKSFKKNGNLRNADGFYNPYSYAEQAAGTQRGGKKFGGNSRIQLEPLPAALPEPELPVDSFSDGTAGDIQLTQEELKGFSDAEDKSIQNPDSLFPPNLYDQAAANAGLLLPSLEPDASGPLTSSNYAKLPRIIVKDEKMMEGAVCPLCFLLSDEEKEELVQSGAMPQISSFEDAFKTADEALAVLFSYKGKGEKFSENERYKAVMYLSAFHAESTRVRALELLRDASRPEFTEGNKEFVRGIIVGAVQWLLFAGPNQEDIQALINHGLSHPDNLVRFMTVRMLGKIAEKDPDQKVFNDSMREEAGQIVIQILQSDPDLFPAIAAAKALPEIIGGEAATIYIDAALEREKKAKRYYILDAAVDAAAKFPSAKYVENLLEVLKIKPPLDGTKDANDRSRILWNYQKLKLKTRTALINIYNMDAVGEGASNATKRKFDGTDMFSVMAGTGDALHQFLALGNEMLGKPGLTSKLRVWIRDLQGVMLEDPLPQDHELNKQTARWLEDEKTFRLELEKKNPDKYKSFMRRAFYKDSTTRLDTGYLMKHLAGAGIDTDFVRLAAGLAIEHHALDLQEALAEGVFFQNSTKAQTAGLKALIYFSIWEKDSGIMVYDSDYFQRLRDLIDLALEGKTVRVPWVSGGFWYDWTSSPALKSFKLTPENRALMLQLYEIITGEKHPSAEEKKESAAVAPVTPEGNTPPHVGSTSSPPSTPTSPLSENSNSSDTTTPTAEPQQVTPDDLVLRYSDIAVAAKAPGKEILIVPQLTGVIAPWNEMPGSDKDRYNKRLRHTILRAKLIAERNPGVQLNVVDSFKAERTAPPSGILGKFISVFSSNEPEIPLPRNLKIVSERPCKGCIPVPFEPASDDENAPNPKPLFDAIQRAVNGPQESAQRTSSAQNRLLLAGGGLFPSLLAGSAFLGLILKRRPAQKNPRSLSAASRTTGFLPSVFDFPVIRWIYVLFNRIATPSGNPPKNGLENRAAGATVIADPSSSPAPNQTGRPLARMAASPSLTSPSEPQGQTFVQPSGTNRRIFISQLAALATLSVVPDELNAAPWTPVEIPELPKSKAGEVPSKIVLRTLWGWIQRSPAAQAARFDLQKQINEGARLKANWSLSLLARRQNGSTSVSAGIARSGIDGLSFDLAAAYETKGLSLISNVTASLLNRLFGVKRQAQEAQQSLVAAAYYRLQDALLLMYSEAANMLVELHYTRKKAALYLQWQRQLGELKRRALTNQTADLGMINQIDTMLGMAKTQAAAMAAKDAEIEAQLMKIIAPSSAAVKGSIETSDADMQKALTEAFNFIPKNGISSPDFLNSLASLSQNHPSVLSAYFAFVAATQNSALWNKRNRASLDISLGGFLDQESRLIEGPSGSFTLPFTAGTQKADKLLTEVEAMQTRQLVLQAQSAFAATYSGMTDILARQLKVQQTAADAATTAAKLLPGGAWNTVGADLNAQMQQSERKTEVLIMALEAEEAALKALNTLETLAPAAARRIDIDRARVIAPPKRSESRLATMRKSEPGNLSLNWKQILKSLAAGEMANIIQPISATRAHIVDSTLLDVNGLTELARSNPNAFWIFLFDAEASAKKIDLEKQLRHNENFRGVLIQSANPFEDAANFVAQKKLATDSVAVGMDDRILNLSESTITLRVLADRAFWLGKVRTPELQLQALKLVFGTIPPPQLAKGLFGAENYLSGIADWLSIGILATQRTASSV